MRATRHGSTRHACGSLPSTSVFPVLPPNSSTSNLGPHLPPDVSSVLDLQLMHHYTSILAPLLADHEQHVQMWVTAVPGEAFKHKFLLHSILAISAFHLYTISSDRKGVLLDSAVKHRDTALAQSKSALEKFTKDNCDAVLAFSTLVVISAFASPHPDEEHSEPIADVLFNIKLLRGVQTVLASGWDWLPKGPLGPLLQIGTSDPGTKLPSNQNVALNNLESAIRGSHLEESSMVACEKAVAELRQTFLDIATFSSSQALVLKWLVSVDELFLALLEERDEIALAVFAHYAVVLLWTQDMWWARGWGARLVKDIDQQLQHSQFAYLLEWAQQQQQLKV